MRECVGLIVSVRVMNGAKWRGVLREVRDNGDVVIRPAQELLYDEPDGDELPRSCWSSATSCGCVATWTRTTTRPPKAALSRRTSP